jgi:hypothetical protein
MSRLDWVFTIIGGLLGMILYALILIGNKLDRITDLLGRDRRQQ